MKAGWLIRVNYWSLSTSIDDRPLRVVWRPILVHLKRIRTGTKNICSWVLVIAIDIQKRYRYLHLHEKKCPPIQENLSFPSNTTVIIPLQTEITISDPTKISSKHTKETVITDKTHPWEPTNITSMIHYTTTERPSSYT